MLKDARFRGRVVETAGFLKAHGMSEARTGVILGSGLSPLVDRVEVEHMLPYSTIPNFPIPTVVGHPGKLAKGKIGHKTLLVMQGRFHYYEGYAPQEATFPVWVMNELGVRTLIVTNAAGGINKGFHPGSLMLISDQIGLMGKNPLRGLTDVKVDMGDCYSPRLRGLAQKVAHRLGIPIRSGVLAGFSGPAYETPAEVEMARRMGADAASMSTTYEVIVAKALGMEVLGISCISNVLSSNGPRSINHGEVIAAVQRVKDKFDLLLTGLVEHLDR